MANSVRSLDSPNEPIVDLARLFFLLRFCNQTIVHNKVLGRSENYSKLRLRGEQRTGLSGIALIASQTRDIQIATAGPD